MALDASEHIVIGDIARLQQVVWKFAGKRFKVRPGRRRDPYKLRNEASLIFVEISDPGIGIEPQALSTVFDAFTQGS